MADHNVRMALYGNTDRRRGGVGPRPQVTDHFLAINQLTTLATVATAANDGVRGGQRSKLTWKFVPRFNDGKYNLASGGTQARDL